MGAELGLSPEDLAAGLATCQANRGRLQLRNGGDWTVLDDTYNANADSMQAALATVRAELQHQHAGDAEVFTRLNVRSAVRRAEREDLIQAHAPPLNAG